MDREHGKIEDDNEEAERFVICALNILITWNIHLQDPHRFSNWTSQLDPTLRKLMSLEYLSPMEMEDAADVCDLMDIIPSLSRALQGSMGNDELILWRLRLIDLLFTVESELEHDLLQVEPVGDLIVQTIVEFAHWRTTQPKS